jgi:hypothetical protein
LEALQAIQNAGMVCPPSMAHDALQNVDALFGGRGVPLPSTVILDYLYGIAAYKAWRSKRSDGFNRMKAYREEHYTRIPPLPPTSPDDPNDRDYKPPKSRKHPSTRRSGLEETMDELNMFLMYIHGITPEMAAERNQKEIEREEQAAQEASRSKVTEWRKHLDVY